LHYEAQCSSSRSKRRPYLAQIIVGAPGSPGEFRTKHSDLVSCDAAEILDVLLLIGQNVDELDQLLIRQRRRVWNGSMDLKAPQPNLILRANQRSRAF